MCRCSGPPGTGTPCRARSASSRACPSPSSSARPAGRAGCRRSGAGAGRSPARASALSVNDSAGEPASGHAAQGPGTPPELASWNLASAHHLGRGGGFCPVALTAAVGFCLLPCPLPLTLVSRAQDFRGPRAVVLQAKPALGRASAPAVWSATRARGTHASFPLHGRNQGQWSCTNVKND